MYLKSAFSRAIGGNARREGAEGRLAACMNGPAAFEAPAVGTRRNALYVDVARGTDSTEPLRIAAAPVDAARAVAEDGYARVGGSVGFRIDHRRATVAAV